jgi:hypothetical protein
MKIALVYLGRRGSGPAFSLHLAAGLAPMAQVRAFISAQADNLTDWQQSGLDLAALPTFQSGVQAAWETLLTRRAAHIAQEISAFKPDVLLFCMFHPWNALIQRRLKTIPSVVIVHDPQPHPGFLPRLHRWGEDGSLRGAKIALVLSQVLAPELARRGVDTGRIRATRHGLLYLRQGNQMMVPFEHALFWTDHPL